jgi:thioredoxin-like negative regulator of GroEL
MTRIVAGLALMLLCASPALPGQDTIGQQPTDQVRQRLEEITQRLALTPDQIAQMRPIFEEEMQKVKALREKHSADGQNRRSKLKMARELRDIQRAADEQFEKILSKKQMDEMKKIRDERRQQLRARAGR